MLLHAVPIDGVQKVPYIGTHGYMNHLLYSAVKSRILVITHFLYLMPESHLRKRPCWAVGLEDCVSRFLGRRVLW